MIGGVKEVGKRGLLAAQWYARKLEGDAFPGVLVLCYHGLRTSSWPAGVPFANLHLTDRVFAAHCRVIADTCHPISLDDWRAALSGGPKLPPRPVLVTFDVGYRNMFEIARPLLRRFRIPAVVFLCSDPIERRELHWFDAVARRDGEEAVRACCALGHEEWRAAMDAYPAAVADSDVLATMTSDQVRILADEGFEIGAHTTRHSVLSAAEPERQREALSQCREVLERWTGRPVNALAYPFGVPRIDYTQETLEIVERLGFDFGFTTRPDFARPDEPALERSRFLMLSSTSPADLAHWMTYTWPRARNVAARSDAGTHGSIRPRLKRVLLSAASAAGGRHACLLPRLAADEGRILDLRAPYRIDGDRLVMELLEPSSGTVTLTLLGYAGHFPTRTLWRGERPYPGSSRVEVDLSTGVVTIGADVWGRLERELTVRRFACQVAVRTADGTVRERLTSHYLVGHSHRIDRSYFEGDTYVDYDAESAADRQTVVELLDRWKAREPLLEIGCATGHLLAEIESHCAIKGFGVDISEWAIAEATRRLGADRVWVADLEQPVPEAVAGRAPFGTIVMFSVLEHLADPRASLERLTTVSQAGTLLLIETTNADSLSHTVFGGDWEGYFDPTHRSVGAINARTLTAWLESLGWRVADCRTRLVWDKSADPTHATIREWWAADARFRRLIKERDLGDLLSVVALKK